MPSKSISITLDVYEMLDKFRMKDESFSEAIQRLIESRLDIMNLAGKWKEIPDVDEALAVVEKVVKQVHEESSEDINLI